MKIKQSIFFIAAISILLFSCQQPSMEKDGGVRIVLEASIGNMSKEEVDKNMDRLCLIIEQRLNSFGVQEPKVQRDFKENRLVIEIPGKVDQKRLRMLLQSSANLEFWETDDNIEIGQRFVAIDELLRKKLYPDLNDSLIGEAQEDTVRSQGNSLNDQLEKQESKEQVSQKRDVEAARKQNPLYSYLRPAISMNEMNEAAYYAQGPVVGYANITDTARVAEYLRMPEVKNILGNNVKFLWSFKPAENAESNIYSLIAIRTNRKNEAPLSGDIVTEAKVLSDDNYSFPQVSITMSSEAAWTWRDLTRNNIGKCIAIVIDDQVYSYPVVQSEIEGGVSSITGSFTKQEAEDFANVLKAGSLPLRCRIVQEDLVKPLQPN